MTDQQELLRLVPGRTVSVAALPLLKVFSCPAERKSGPRTILFFGIVRKYKGLDILLRALPKVLSKIECELIVAGEFYESVDRYLQIIRECQIERYVHIENRYVPNEEVTALFCQADVLVLPYLSASQSGVVQIAFSNGLPVIASRTGGLSEVVVENLNGLLVPPGDANALGDAILHYFIDNLSPILSKNLLQLNLDNEANRVGKIIEEMAGRGIA